MQTGGRRVLFSSFQPRRAERQGAGRHVPHHRRCPHPQTLTPRQPGPPGPEALNPPAPGCPASPVAPQDLRPRCRTVPSPSGLRASVRVVGAGGGRGRPRGQRPPAPAALGLLRGLGPPTDVAVERHRRICFRRLHGAPSGPFRGRAVSPPDSGSARGLRPWRVCLGLRGDPVRRSPAGLPLPPGAGCSLSHPPAWALSLPSK